MSLFNRLKLMVGIKNKSLKLSDNKIKKYFLKIKLRKKYIISIKNIFKSISFYDLHCEDNYILFLDKIFEYNFPLLIFFNFYNLLFLFEIIYQTILLAFPW